MKYIVGLIGALIIFLPSHLSAQIDIKQYGPYYFDFIMTSLIRDHPWKKVADDLDRWLTSGQMVLSYDADPMPLQMSLSLLDVKGKIQPVLAVNPEFLFSRRADLSDVTDRKLKLLILNHMYSFLKDHIDKGLSLRPQKLKAGETPEERAWHVWSTELTALQSDWALLKKMNAEFLLPRTRAAIERNGEELGYIEVLHEMTQTPGYQKNITPEINAALKAIYEKEKARLTAIAKK